MRTYAPPAEVKRFVCLAYGKTGTEKTRTIRTMPSPLVLDFEDRLLSIRGEAVKAVRPESYAEVISFLNDPDRYVKQGLESGAWQDAAWETLVIDSLTAGQAMLLTSTPEAFGKAADPGLETAIVSEKWDVRRNYNLAASRVRNVIRMARNMTERLGKHLFIICHEGVEKDEMTGRVEGGPLLAGKLPFEAPHLFDFVFRFEVAIVDGKPQARVQTKNVSIYGAKDASGVLDVYEPPDFRVWWKKINTLVKP